MAKISSQKNILQVKDTAIKTLSRNGIDYICITDIARQKNPVEPKDVVKNWMRVKNTLEYLGLWEKLNNPDFKGGEFDPLLAETGSNAFTMSPSRWVEITGAIGIITKNGAGGVGSHYDTGKHHLCRGGRRAQRGDVRHDRPPMARSKSGAEREHPRLCHHQRTHLPIEHGKPQRRIHRTRYAARRTPRQAQQDCHPADPGIGG